LINHKCVCGALTRHFCQSPYVIYKRCLEQEVDQIIFDCKNNIVHP
jgi:hypothetical protein